MPARARPAPQVTLRIALAVSALLSAILVLAAGFATWMSVTGEFADGLTVNGWGLLGGTGELAGSNINQVLDELGQSGSYRQAQLPTVLAGVALIPALVLVFRNAKFAAAGLAGLGFFILLWGAFRGLFPGNLAGILDPGEAHGSFGPWLVAIGGLEMMVVAAVVLTGRTQPPDRPQAKISRGIQPK